MAKSGKKKSSRRGSTRRGKKPAYGLWKQASSGRAAAPALEYRPRDPKAYRPAIGLVGCGGISQTHLQAYKKAGYNVVALCDRHVERAQKRRDEFFPKAEAFTEAGALLARGDIEVVDITTHPADRVGLIERALLAGKHVLSQKPFVLDLAEGRRLAALAKKQGRRLAVNQNGRFAPHVAYMRKAVAAGLVGEVMAAHIAISWNHNWIADTKFNDVPMLVLFDFAIHWFDMLHCFMGEKQARRVYASDARSPGQKARPNLLAQALVEYEGAQGTLSFDGDARCGHEDRTIIVGTRGTLHSVGPSLSKQKVTLHTKAGVASPRLRGTWFCDGFHGAMAELLCAVEEGREPMNNALDNLEGLALCFAAMQSARTHRAVAPGTVKRAGV